MTEEQKKSLIDYMVKYCGFSEKNANRRFHACESKLIENRKPIKKKRNLLSGKKMTKEQIISMVLYMHRHGFDNWWIVKSMGISDYEVSDIITKHKRSL